MIGVRLRDHLPDPRALRKAPLGLVALAGWLMLASSQTAAQPGPPDAAPVAGPPRAYGLIAGVTFDSEVLDVRGRSQGLNGVEFVARANPTLTLVHRGSRLQGSLIYSGSLVSRRGVDDRSGVDYLNNLSASYALEAIEGLAFVDARAAVTQQLFSAVSGPAGLQQADAKDRTEAITLSVSPYVRGTLGGAAEFEFRALGAATEGGNDAFSGSRTKQASFYLRSPRRAALIGWGLAGSRQEVGFVTASEPTITDRLTAELTYQPDVDLRLTLSGGQERTDVVGALRQDYANYGVGLRWAPSTRTTVSLLVEERYFGKAHQAIVEHRFMRSTFQLSSSRQLNVTDDAVSRGVAVTLYELYFSQFAASIPDPIQRDQFVRALIQSLGRNRDEVVSAGTFGINGVAALRRHDAIWTWAGRRLTMSGSAYTVDSERVDIGGVTPAGRNDKTGQSGYAASVGWRLTPLTSVNANGTRTMTKDITTLQGSDLKSVSLGLTTQLGPRVSGALSTRYSVFNSPLDAYRQTALTGSLSLRF